MIKVYRQYSSGQLSNSDLFIRQCLGKFLGQSPENVEIGRATSGQPFLIDKASVSFSLSHSGELFVLACSNNFDIGIDIQKYQPFNPALFERICTRKELLSVQDQNEEMFYSYWTLKEAALKAIGMGLVYPMNQIEINFDDQKIELLENHPDIHLLFEGHRQRMGFERLRLFENTASHLVWSLQGHPPKIEIVE